MAESYSPPPNPTAPATCEGPEAADLDVGHEAHTEIATLLPRVGLLLPELPRSSMPSALSSAGS